MGVHPHAMPYPISKIPETYKRKGMREEEHTQDAPLDDTRTHATHARKSHCHTPTRWARRRSSKKLHPDFAAETIASNASVLVNLGGWNKVSAVSLHAGQGNVALGVVEESHVFLFDGRHQALAQVFKVLVLSHFLLQVKVDV